MGTTSFKHVRFLFDAVLFSLLSDLSPIISKFDARCIVNLSLAFM